MAAHQPTKFIHSATNSVEVHLLPFNIDYNGKAKVDEHFKSSMQEEKNPQNEKPYCSASFRGRPLNGVNIEVPKSYRGVVIKEEMSNGSNEKVFHTDSTFDKLTYWNLESIPSDGDALPQALEWINIANVLHADIDDEEDQEQHL